MLRRRSIGDGQRRGSPRRAIQLVAVHARSCPSPLLVYWLLPYRHAVPRRRTGASGAAALPRRRVLRVLRGVRLALPAAAVVHATVDYNVGQGPRAGRVSRRAGAAAAAREPGREPRRARLLQVRGLLRRPGVGRARQGQPRPGPAGAVDPAAGRHLLLHVPVDRLRRSTSTAASCEPCRDARATSPLFVAFFPQLVAGPIRGAAAPAAARSGRRRPDGRPRRCGARC